MKQYIIRKIWEEIEPSLPISRWILTTVIRDRSSIEVTEEERIQLIYRYYHGIKMVGQKYLDKFNGARADLIADLIDPPAEVGSSLPVSLQPGKADISYWLCQEILGLTDKEIMVLSNISKEDLINPYMKLIPLLKVAFKTLRMIRLQDENLYIYHRAKYRLVRYYLDAHYHVINN